MKKELTFINKLEGQKKAKDENIKKESKIIMKKEKEARKLEFLE